MKQIILSYFILLSFSSTVVLSQDLIPTKKNGKWGLANSKEKILIPFEHDRIFYLADGVYAYWKGEEVRLYGQKWKSKKIFRDAGLLDKTAHTLVLADKNGKYGLYTTKGKEVLSFDFHAPPRPLDDKILLSLKNGLGIDFGLYSLSGENIIPPIYYSIGKWGEFYKCITQTGKEIYTDQNGDVVLELESGTLDWTSGDFFILKGDDYDFQEVISRKTSQSFFMKDPQYRGGIMVGQDSSGVTSILTSEGQFIRLELNQKLRRSSKEYFLICKTDSNQRCTKDILFDHEMNVIIPPEFDEISEIYDQMAVVRPDRTQQKYNLYRMGENPKFLLADKRKIKLFNHGWIKIWEEEEFYFVNADLEVQTIPYQKFDQLPEKYISLPISTFSKTSKSDSKKNIDPDLLPPGSQKLIFPFEADEVRSLSDNYRENPVENRLIVRGKWQNYGQLTMLIDRSGKVLTNLRHSHISHYQEGLIYAFARDTIDGESKTVAGLLDMNGKVQIPFEYDKIRTVTPKHIIAEKHGVLGIISRQNEIILPFRYGYIRYVDDYYLISRYNKYGIVSSDGKILTPIKYNDIKSMEGGIGYKAKLGDKIIHLDLDGKEIPNN